MFLPRPPFPIPKSDPKARNETQEVRRLPYPHPLPPRFRLPSTRQAAPAKSSGTPGLRLLPFGGGGSLPLIGGVPFSPVIRPATRRTCTKVGMGSKTCFFAHATRRRPGFGVAGFHLPRNRQVTRGLPPIEHKRGECVWVVVGVPAGAVLCVKPGIPCDALHKHINMKRIWKS